jgi:hypothetical protein
MKIEEVHYKYINDIVVAKNVFYYETLASDIFNEVESDRIQFKKYTVHP